MVYQEQSIESLENGKVVVVHGTEKSVPLFCQVCNLPLKTLDDVICYKTHEACNKCEMWWSGSKLGSWKDGWRPGPETIGWDEYILERKLLLKTLITLR